MRTNRFGRAHRLLRRGPAARLLTPFLLAVLLTGCGSGDSSMDPDDESPADDDGSGATFSVAVNGAESFVSSGTLAWSGGTAAENGWEVRLESLEVADQLRSVRINGDGDRPGAGDTYAIVSTQEQAAANEFYGRCQTASGETYYAISGTLTIESSSDATVEGTFSFAAESPTGAAVSVSGTFRSDDVLDE